MYFMSNCFQTVYYLCKELQLRCCRIPGTKALYLLLEVSGTYRFIISLIYLGFFGTRKSTRGEVALLGFYSSFKSKDKKGKIF